MFYKLKTHIVSICLSLFIVAGAFRTLFGLDQKIYFILIGVLFLAFIFDILKTKKLPKNLNNYIIFGASFILWLTLSSTWTISYAQWKKDLLLVIGLFVLLLLASYNINNQIVELFKKYAIIFCGIVALLVIYHSGGIFNIKGYGTLVNKFYLTAGNPIAVGFIISLVHYFYYDSKKLFWLILSIFFTGALGVSLSRGALIFSILIILFLIFFIIDMKFNSIRIKKKHFFRYLVFIIPILSSLIYISLNVERTKSRLIRMTSIKHELLSGGRGALWKDSWEGIVDSPFFGYGLGGNGLVVGSDDNYPHNLLLQIWLDGGIVALILGVLFLSYPIYLFFKNIRKTKYNLNSILMLSLYVFYFFNYSKSSNFYTARDIIIMGILLVFCVSFAKSIRHVRIKLNPSKTNKY